MGDVPAQNKTASKILFEKEIKAGISFKPDSRDENLCQAFLCADGILLSILEPGKLSDNIANALPCQKGHS